MYYFYDFDRLANSCISELFGGAEDRAEDGVGSYSKPSAWTGALEDSSPGVGKHELPGLVWWPWQTKGLSPQRETQ